MTPKKAYDDQRRHAEGRGIDWLFTYEEWLEKWMLSGKWFERGRSPDQYCMCRFGDEGPYSNRNCFIATNQENLLQRWEGREKITDEFAKEISEMYLTTSLSQREVAEKFGVDQSYVSRIVNKKRKKAA
jgi:hypothetical protein